MTSLFPVLSIKVKRPTSRMEARHELVRGVSGVLRSCNAERASGNLAQFGLEPVIAADMNEVRAILAQHLLQLVICEDGLPEGGFREALRLAKTTGSEVPVVVCSLLGEMDQYLEAMELGAFDFIAPHYRRTEVEFIVN